MRLFIQCFLVIILAINFNSCDRVAYADKNASVNVSNTPTTNKNFSSRAQKDSIYLSAKIVGVQDGDTVEALYNDELLLKVRLAHIDAPEKRKSQPFGKAAKQALSNLCFGQTVTLVSKGQGERDGYGRLIAVIKNAKGVNCNQEMVRLGMAWHFKKYSNSETYARLEDRARNKKIGLWSDSKAVPPWAWRKR